MANYLEGHILNKIPSVDYTGVDGDTANVIVDNDGRKIEAEVKKLPHELTIVGKTTVSFDGSQDQRVEISSVTKSDTNGNIVVDGEEMQVYDEQEVKDDISDLNDDIDDVKDDITALNERVDALSFIGRFLSTWDAETGVPGDYPSTSVPSPYVFKSGDHFLISEEGFIVPTGSQIELVEGQWVINTTTVTEKLNTGAYWIYSGNGNWTALNVASKDITIDNVAGLRAALNSKEDESNKVALSSSNTTDEYPNAKSVYDECVNIREIAEGKNKAIVFDYLTTSVSTYMWNTYFKADGTAFASQADLEAYILGRTSFSFDSNDDSIGWSEYDNYHFWVDMITSTRHIIMRSADEFRNHYKLKNGDVIYLTPVDKPDRWVELGGSFPGVNFHKLETTKVNLGWSQIGTTADPKPDFDSIYVKKVNSGLTTITSDSTLELSGTNEAVLESDDTINIDAGVDLTIHAGNEFSVSSDGFLYLEGSNGLNVSSDAGVYIYGETDGVYISSTDGDITLSTADGDIYANDTLIPADSTLITTDDVATSSTAGITKVGAEGGAAAYSHTHSQYELSDNKVALDSTNTNTQYPNAKSVWDECVNIRAVAEGKSKTFIVNPATSIATYLYDQYSKADGTPFTSQQELEDFIDGRPLVNGNFANNNDEIYLYDSQFRTDTLLIIDGPASGEPGGKIYETENFPSILKAGDIFLYTATEYPDRWVKSSTGGTPGTTLCKLETSKVDLTNYVDKTSDESITGVKNFTNGASFNASTWNYKIKPNQTDDSLDFLQDSTVFMSVLNDISFAKNLVPIGTKDLGSSTAKWQNLYLSGTSNAKEYVQMDGSYGIKIYKDEYNKTCVSHTSNGGTSWAKVCELGDYMVDTYSIRPLSTAQYDIGSSTRLYKDIYLAGNITDGTNSIAVANIGAKRARSNITGATATIASAGSLTDYFMTNSAGITSLSVTAYSAASGDSNPYWSFSFVAASGFSISLPSGTTWSDGTPVFIAGREYRVIVHAGMAANAYKAHLIED